MAGQRAIPSASAKGERAKRGAFERAVLVAKCERSRGNAVGRGFDLGAADRLVEWERESRALACCRVLMAGSGTFCLRAQPERLGSEQQ